MCVQNLNEGAQTGRGNSIIYSMGQDQAGLLLLLRRWMLKLCRRKNTKARIGGKLSQ